MTVEDLDAIGSIEAYRRLKAAGSNQVTIVALYALEAALLDIAWTDLPPDTRARLRQAASGGSSRPSDRLGRTQA